MKHQMNYLEDKNYTFMCFFHILSEKEHGILFYTKKGKQLTQTERKFIANSIGKIRRSH